MKHKTPEELSNYKISDIIELNYECQGGYEITTDFYEAEIFVINLGTFDPLTNFKDTDEATAVDMVLFVNYIVKRVTKLVFTDYCKQFAENKLKNWMKSRCDLLGIDILIEIRTLGEYSPGNVKNPQNAIDIYREHKGCEPSEPNKHNMKFIPPKISMKFVDDE